jgi:hypothetical protein
MKRNDILWKSMLEDIFDDFLRFFFVNAEELFDLERGFEYLDKELEQLFPPEGDQWSPKYVDKLVKVYNKCGLEEWVLIHIEVQGYQDHTFRGANVHLLLPYLGQASQAHQRLRHPDRRLQALSSLPVRSGLSGYKLMLSV